MAKEAAIQAKAATQAALSDVRQSVSSLRDGGERFCLRSALDTLVGQIDDDTLQIRYELCGDELVCSQKILLTLYRVAQEGLTNVVKHASATKVDLKISFLSESVLFVMQDNGVGLAVESIDGQQGFGLQGIQERVELVSGTVKIASNSGGGTTLNLRIPYRSI